MPAQLRPRCVAVTGARGFVGSAIVSACHRAGLEVIAIDRRPIGNAAMGSFRQADISVREEAVRAFEGVDCVVHAAGLAHQFRGAVDSRRFHEVNAIGTETAARASLDAGVRHFVLISSVAVYGSGRPEICTEDVECLPSGPYATSKLLSERLAHEALAGSSLRLTILRPATVFGEGDPGNIARLVAMIDRGWFLWIGGGENRKSLVHRDDLARACVQVVSSPTVQLGPFNVTGGTHTMLDIVSALAAALGRPVPNWHISPRVAMSIARTTDRLLGVLGLSAGANRLLERWLGNDAYDGSRFGAAYGFVAEVSLCEGLEREVRWYRDNRGTSVPN